MSQHMDALARANEIRLARADLKHRIARGETTVAAVLADPPDYVTTMPISALLMAQHRWGSTLARRLLRSLTISELRPVGGLTARERTRISERLTMTADDLRWAA